MQESMLNKHGKFGVKILWRYTDMAIFVLRCFILTHPVEEHSQQGFVKDWNHLGGSRGGSSKQIRMALECGPMHPFESGLNQGQGQVAFIVIYS